MCIGLGSTACKSESKVEKENQKKVTVSSKVDATEQLIDENYRFRIEWPAKGWRPSRSSVEIFCECSVTSSFAVVGVEALSLAWHDSSAYES